MITSAKIETSIAVTAIHPDPTNVENEYVEMTYNGDSPWNLAGTVLLVVSSGREFVFPVGATVAAGTGNKLRIYTNKFVAETGGYTFGSKAPIWNPKGDVGRYINAAGIALSEHAYGDSPAPIPAPAQLEATVFHGQHTHVDGYAKNSALSIILDPKQEGPDAVVCLTFDHDAADVKNVTSQIPAKAAFEGGSLVVRTDYYWFKGAVKGKVYEGQTLNPQNKVVGSFKLTSDTLPDGRLEATIFHGKHTHVDGYAKDSPLTFVLDPGTTGPTGIVCITWTKDAAGTPNATGQMRAKVTREGDTITLRTGYYWFKGTLNGKVLEGQYWNPRNELCGNFKLTTPG